MSWKKYRRVKKTNRQDRHPPVHTEASKRIHSAGDVLGTRKPLTHFNKVQVHHTVNRKWTLLNPHLRFYTKLWSKNEHWLLFSCICDYDIYYSIYHPCVVSITVSLPHNKHGDFMFSGRFSYPTLSINNLLVYLTVGFDLFLFTSLFIKYSVIPFAFWSWRLENKHTYI